MNHSFVAFTFLVFVAVAAAIEEPAAGRLDFDAALAAAKTRHAPVFIDFHAPWCHSCFFMDKHVMTGGRWDAVTRRAVITDVDSDSPEGATIAKRFGIKGWPTYVVLDEKGAEIGRILGDRPFDQFYRELEPMLENGAVLDQWQAKVVGGSKGSMAAARTVLKAYYEREDYAAGVAWALQLPEAARQGVEADADAKDLLNRLKLLDAATRGDAQGCIAAAPAILGGAIDCGNLGELNEFQGCLSGLPADEQKKRLAPFKPKMEALQQSLLVDGKGTCSDTRGIVDTAAELYDGLGDPAAITQVLRQGVAYSDAGLKGDYTRDHHLADNLRYYLDRLGDHARLDEVFPKLIAAYPDTYDYYLRYGKNLAKRNQFTKALGYLEQAAPKSYGRNRLWVAEWRAYSLLALKRPDEAKAVATEALQANGPWFEKDIADLQGVLQGKAPP